MRCQINGAEYDLADSATVTDAVSCRTKFCHALPASSCPPMFTVLVPPTSKEPRMTETFPEVLTVAFVNVVLSPFPSAMLSTLP